MLLQLHAPYEAELNDTYMCHRTAQAWEIAKLMRHAAERGHLVLGLGDFNMIPSSLAHRLIESHAPVKDVWQIVHPGSALGSALCLAEKARGRPVPSADECISEHGTTCDSNFNTWRWSKQYQKLLEKGHDRYIDGREADPRAKRLDYVFFGGDRETQSSHWKVESVDLGMMDRHPTLKCSLSDHFSVEATLIQTGRNNIFEPTGELEHLDAMPEETYDEILSMIHKYGVRERRQRKWRMRHFWGQFGVSIGCFVATWWSPRDFVCFILMLISTLGLSAGVIDGLIGWLFVGSELRALKEFEWEISNAKNNAERHSDTEGRAMQSSRRILPKST